MSKITGKIRAIWKRLGDKEYRDAYVAGKVANDIAFQVYYLREHRGWTQGRLAQEADTKQPAISRIERSIGSLNVGTLLKIASAFNVGLSIRFVPFSRLVAQAMDENEDADVASFDTDLPPLFDSLPVQATRLKLIRFDSDETDEPALTFVGATGTSGANRATIQ